MTLRERIRFLADGLRDGQWLSLVDLYARIPHVHHKTIALTVHRMHDRDELTRRGTKRLYEYRSGPQPVVARKPGAPKKTGVRMGFMALARLERNDPQEWQRVTGGGRR